MPGARFPVLFTTLTAVVLTALLAAPGAVLAQEKKERTKQTVAMSQAVFKALKEGQDLIEANQVKQGLGVVRKILKDGGLSPYEEAQAWNLTAYGYYLIEDYPKSIKAYANVLKNEELPEALILSTLKTLSQLYFTVEDYRNALKTVDRLIAKVDDPAPEIYMLRGQAFYQLEEYKNAIGPIRTGIDKFRAQGQQPKENWLLLLRVCYHQLADYKNMLPVIKELIALYPKDRYLQTLAGVYSELGDTKKQLALTEALYEDGKLDSESQISNLANLYLVHGLPYKAANLLDREIAASRLKKDERTLRVLSQAWYQAREDEKAIPPLMQAAGMAADGELYLRLAQSYINLERWGPAAEAVQNALTKGGLKRVDTANVMLGMALFNQRKLDAARKAFQVAAKDKRSSRAARQWITFVDSEIRRDSTLNQIVPEAMKREEDEILKNL